MTIDDVETQIKETISEDADAQENEEQQAGAESDEDPKRGLCTVSLFLLRISTDHGFADGPVFLQQRRPG